MQDRFKFRIPMFTDKGNFGEFQYIELGETIECYTGGFNKNPQQCTGLKDKNGKLIYEGDIFGLDGDLCFIYWHSYLDARFAVDIDGGCYDLYDVVDEDIKIIGNIYENPELLKVNNAT